MPIRNKITAIIVSLIFIIFAKDVFAHRVYLFAYRDGDTVYTESYFGKAKVQGGEIRVYDGKSGELLLKGKTDDKGLFSFKMSPDKDIRIELIASMGHRAEFFLKGSEEQEQISQKTHRGDSDIITAEKKGILKESPCIGVDEVKEIIKTTLDSRLKSIHDRLTEIQEEKGPGFTEIIGGIGYIIGLMGIVLYFKSRKRS